MNDRSALINFHNYMLSMYGQNYREVWTTDDRETADILESRVSKATLRIETPFLKRFKGHLVAPEKVTPAERREAWAMHAKKHGSGIQGKLTGDGKRYSMASMPEEFEHDERDAFHGEIPIAGQNKSHAVVFKAPVTDPEPLNKDSAAWFMWKTRQTA